MGATFEASIDADEVLAKVLEKYGAKTADLSPVMAVVAQQLVAAVEDEFATSGHGKWPPLAPSTLGKGKWSGAPKVGSKRHAKAMQAYYEAKGAGASDRDAQGAARRAGGMKFKTRGQSFADADRIGSQKNFDTRAAYYEAIGDGKTHEEAQSAALRVAHHGGILQDTGALAGSIRGEHGPDFALATTDKFYAVFHVSDAPRTIIPLRNFFDVPDEVYEVAAKTILDTLST